MIPSPLVSVIIPCYNIFRYPGNFLRDAINSVRLQTYQNWEIILVDDCSSDATADYIKKAVKELSERGVKIHAHFLPKNSGVSVARNAGIDMASGEYIALLDFDDLFLPEHLERAVKTFLSNPKLEALFGPAYFWIAFGEKVKVYESKVPSFFNEMNRGELICYSIINSFPFTMGSGPVIKAGVLKGPSGLKFSEFLSKKSAEDVDLGFQMLKAKKNIYGLQTPSVLVRSFVDKGSRRQNALVENDIKEIYDYIYEKNIKTLLNEIKATISPEKQSEAERAVCFKKNLFLTLRVVQQGDFFQQLRFIFNPGFFKHWFRMTLLQLASKNSFLSKIKNEVVFFKTKDDPAIKEKIFQFISTLNSN